MSEINGCPMKGNPPCQLLQDIQKLTEKVDAMERELHREERLRKALAMRAEQLEGELIKAGWPIPR